MKHLLLCLLLLPISQCKQRGPVSEVKAEPSQRSARWTADFTTLEGRIEVSQSFIMAHPQSVMENLAFNRSLLDAIQGVPDLLRELGDEAASVEVGDTPFLSYRYQGGDVVEDAQAMGEIKADIFRAMDNVRAELGQFSDLVADAERLPTSDQKLLRNFLIVAPVVYDPTSGKSLPDPQAHLEGLGNVGLNSLYVDNFKEHIRPQIEQVMESHPNWGAASNGLKNNFFPKVEKATAYVNAEGKKVSTKSVSIERAPAAMSAYRCHGGDCSILSVPFHGFTKDTRVHWIRTSERPSDQPTAQALSTLVTVEGRKVPYIVTINVNLNVLLPYKGKFDMLEFA